MVITSQYLVYILSYGARMLMRPCLCAQAELVARWNELPQAVKAQIRQLLLSTLASEVMNRSAQCKLSLLRIYTRLWGPIIIQPVLHHCCYRVILDVGTCMSLHDPWLIS